MDTTSEFKTPSAEADDIFRSYMDTIVTIFVRGYDRTIAGKVVEISSAFITLEHRDGRRTVVRKRAVSIISPHSVERV